MTPQSASVPQVSSTTEEYARHAPRLAAQNAHQQQCAQSATPEATSCSMPQTASVTQVTICQEFHAAHVAQPCHIASLVRHQLPVSVVLEGVHLQWEPANAPQELFPTEPHVIAVPLAANYVLLGHGAPNAIRPTTSCYLSKLANVRRDIISLDLLVSSVPLLVVLPVAVPQSVLNATQPTISSVTVPTAVSVPLVLL